MIIREQSKATIFLVPMCHEEKKKEKRKKEKKSGLSTGVPKMSLQSSPV